MNETADRAPTARLESLDALRGFDMLFISGLSSLVASACVMLGCPECWLAEQMRHVAWEGLHHHDTIFPLFLFLAGASWPFSFAAQRARGRSTASIVLKLVRRAVVLSLFAAVFGGLLTFDWPNVRWLDVLTTIGVCGGISAVICMCVRDVRARLVILAGILVGYYLLLRLVPAPDALSVPMPVSPEWQGSGPFSLVGNLCGYVDRKFLPGLYYTYVGSDGVGLFEEDGILHNVSAVATAMLGVFAGEIVRREGTSDGRKVLTLLACAAGCLVATLVWMPFCPIIMKIWSPTYVLANGAYSFLMLAIFYWIVDVRGWRSWAFALKAVGMNSIAIYLMNRTGLMPAVAKYLFGGVASLTDVPGWPTFAVSAGLLAVNVLVMCWLHRNKVFLKV